MYQQLGRVALKTGEAVEVGVVAAPDLDWAERLKELIGPFIACSALGDPWVWQVREVLESNVGIEFYAYVLHRDGKPFSNFMTAEVAGVGIVCHVWTNPGDRRKGAMSRLMEKQMVDFRDRGGKALFLSAEFDGPAYHIYRKHGFEGVEENSNYMEYYATSREEFEGAYFAKGETEIVGVDWPHWPAAEALFMGDFPGVVRCAPLGLLGRLSPELAILKLIREERKRRQEGEAPHAQVLQHKQSSAVVGLALWDWDPLWPETCLVDIYCHPDYWEKAGALMSSLVLPDADRYLAYADSKRSPKIEALKAAGFRPTVTFAKRVAVDTVKSEFVSVTQWER